MTERERIALLDFCTQKFQSEHCYVGRAQIGAPPGKRNNLTPANRIWSSVGFSGFKQDSMEYRLSAVINGQRSDGQMFAVVFHLPGDFDPEGDRVAFVEAKIKKAYGMFDSYKDCSCGVIGHELTNEKDSDGDYIYQPIYSPCSTHPPIIEPDSLS